MKYLIFSILLSALILLAAQPALAQDTMPWHSYMSLPAAYDQQHYRTSDTAPYIVCTPDFGDVVHYYEYSVEFRAEHLPNATYLSVLNWYTVSNQLNRQYKEVTRDFGLAGYCGFQSLADGKRVAIMSIWDTFCKDTAGRTTVIRAKQTYPEASLSEKYRQQYVDGVPVQWGDEGRFVQCMVDYDWKEDHSYRACIQIFNTYTGKSAELVFGVHDLETGEWTLLMRFELGYDEAYMLGGCVFLENYLPRYAGELRSMVLSNFEVTDYHGKGVVRARGATFSQNYDHAGSYNFGSDGSRFWAITTGIPGRGRNPGRGYYTVSAR